MADRRLRRVVVLILAACALIAAVVVSFTFGSNPLSASQTWELLLEDDGSISADVVRGQRVPRTVVALVVGCALGLAGALMQALTRNPLADPGILGVNAGASLFVVLAVAVAGFAGIWFYLWFAFAGAALGAFAVYFLGGGGRPASGPARLALAGVALTAATTSLTQAVILADQVAFNEFRLWVVGSVEGRGWDVALAVGPFMAIGAVLALALGPALGALALGDESAHGLGVRVARTRAAAMLAITLLCGAATAAIGPVVFVGLAVPMIARALMGHDQRWVQVCSILLGGVWLLVADTLGRVVLSHQEVPAGIMAAIAGGPIFVAVACRRRLQAL